MKNKQLILGFFILGIFTVLGWLLLRWSFTWLSELDATVSASIITAILGLSGLWYAQWHSKTRDIAESHRSSKIEVYSLFFDIVEKFQEGEVEDEDLIEDQLPDWLKKDYQKLNRGLLLWASPKVIRSWLKFRTITTSGGDVLMAMDEMYKAIRNDLGNSNRGLKAGDLIRVGLKDPNELKS